MLRFLCFLFALVVLTGCGGGGSVPPPTPAPTATPTPAPTAVPTKAPITASYLYVGTGADAGGSGVSVFGPTGTAPLSVILASSQVGGVIVFDSTGNLYDGGGALVQEFAAKAPHALLRTIRGFTQVYALAVDASDNVYVVDYGYPLCAPACAPSTLSVVPPGAKTASRTFPGGLYLSVAVGPDGRVYAGQRNSDVTVFSPGATSAIRNIPATAGAQSLVFDTLGNLYAYAYTYDAFTGVYSSKVSVYAPGAGVPTRTITAGIGVPSYPQALAIDARNDLFVANGNPFVTTSPPAPYVVEYAPLSATPIRTLTSFVNPLAVAVDPVGNVYVVDFNFNTTTGSDLSLAEYAPGSATATRAFPGAGPGFGLATHP